MADSSSLEAVLKRDRALVLAGLAALSVLAWAYLVYLAWEMPRMEMAMDMSMPHLQAWGPVDFILMFAMWSVMMVAMMVPSATPMILMFATVNRRRREPVGLHICGCQPSAGSLRVGTNRWSMALTCRSMVGSSGRRVR